MGFLFYCIAYQCKRTFPAQNSSPFTLLRPGTLAFFIILLRKKCLLHKSNQSFNECNTCNCASLNFCEYKYLVSLLRILACRGLCADCSQCLVTNKSNTVYFIIIEIFVKLDLPDTVTVDSIVFQDFFKKECTSSLLSSIWNQKSKGRAAIMTYKRYVRVG